MWKETSVILKYKKTFMLGNKKKHSCRAKLRKDVQVEHWKVYSQPHLKNKRGIRKDTGSVEFFLLSILD